MPWIVCRYSAAEARADVNQGVVRNLIMQNGFPFFRNQALITGAGPPSGGTRICALPATSAWRRVWAAAAST